MAASLIAASAAAAHADVVYSNTNSPLNQNFNAGSLEIGDEINLGGTARELSQFDFQYYAINLSGGETARVRIYANDGLPVPGNPSALRPGSVLWDSDPFLVNSSPGATLKWSVLDGNLPANIILPDRITFSVVFTGIDVGESAGVALYSSPQDPDQYSLPDYWENVDGVNNWQLKTNANFPMNFGASVQAVPEPSFLALCVAGGLCGFYLVRRRSAQK